MTTRRHFLITAPLGLMAATLAASALPPHARSVRERTSHHADVRRRAG